MFELDSESTSTVVLLQYMKRANYNEAITHMAMPERRIPVLLPSGRAKQDGQVSFPPHKVRRVPATAMEMFLDAKGRGRFENEYGIVSEADRVNLLYMLGMANAIANNSWKSVIKVIAERAGTDEDAWVHLYSSVRQNPLVALNKALNNGLRKIRFVVWWADHEKRFAPGLYCKDPGSALYALAIAHLGDSGTLAICLRCGTPLITSRRRQKYCSYRCRAAAGMSRYRARKARKGKDKWHRKGQLKNKR